MRLRIQHKLIQIQHPRLTKHRIKILQRLRQPKALHLILLPRLLSHHVLDLCVRDLCPRIFLDIQKQFPGSVLQGFVAGQAVQDEDRLDGFGAQEVARVGDGGEACWDAVFFQEVLGALGGVEDLGSGGVGALFGEDGGVVGLGVPGAV